MYPCRTHSFDTLLWHIRETLLLDILDRDSCKTVFSDTLQDRCCETLSYSCHSCRTCQRETLVRLLWSTKHCIYKKLHWRSKVSQGPPNCCTCKSRLKDEAKHLVLNAPGMSQFQCDLRFMCCLQGTAPATRHDHQHVIAKQQSTWDPRRATKWDPANGWDLRSSGPENPRTTNDWWKGVARMILFTGHFASLRNETRPEILAKNKTKTAKELAPLLSLLNTINRVKLESDHPQKLLRFKHNQEIRISLHKNATNRNFPTADDHVFLVFPVFVFCQGRSSPE